MQKNKNASRSLSKWFFPPELQKKMPAVWRYDTYLPTVIILFKQNIQS